MKHPNFLAASALSIIYFLSNEAHASGFTEVIPASACQLENEDDIGKADIVDGSWLIGATVANDEVELICPVRTSHFAYSGATQFQLFWSDIEIFYRDPDGTGTSHSIIATLIEVGRTTALGTSLGTITSGIVNLTTDTRWEEPLLAFADPVADAQHFVHVVLKQGSNNGSDRVRLTRIRLFLDPPGFTEES